MFMTSPLCPFYLRDFGSSVPYAPSVAERNIGTLQIAFRKAVLKDQDDLIYA
jgi:hypothetical protein